MPQINAAFVTDDIIWTVATFDEDTFDAVAQEILPYLPPNTEIIKISDLPSGAWVGWYRVNGVWIDPNPPLPAEDPPEEEGE